MEIKNNPLLELQDWSWSFQNGEGLGVEKSLRRWGLRSGKVSEWRNAILGRKCLRDWGQLWKGWTWRRLRNELWELWMAWENPLVVWTHVIILCWSIFDHYRCSPAFSLVGVYEKEVGRAKWIGGTLNALCLIWRLWINGRSTNLFITLQIFWN